MRRAREKTVRGKSQRLRSNFGKLEFVFSRAFPGHEHFELFELIVVGGADVTERKRKLLDDADVLVALPWPTWAASPRPWRGLHVRA